MYFASPGAPVNCTHDMLLACYASLYIGKFFPFNSGTLLSLLGYINKRWRYPQGPNNSAARTLVWFGQTSALGSSIFEETR